MLMVDRPWLRQQLSLPDVDDDPERLVDILHARFIADPPTDRKTLGQTLGISAATVSRREHRALDILLARDALSQLMLGDASDLQHPLVVALAQGQGEAAELDEDDDEAPPADERGAEEATEPTGEPA